ncbi:alpha/beta hydrolase fold domain-containing protein [Horticoccus sp. 23ND18S-11]|uniref:alpha/beta hydrolase fold domain-containing protein n=1 Tax=Horticoccus sp. 23ND18S-11 TaxID=3391832 RepID=UPI0039C9EACB
MNDFPLSGRSGRWRPLVLVGCGLGLMLLPLLAAESSARLQELLKQYPAADTNRDGVLTIEEAQAHAKVLRRGRSGGTTLNDDGTSTPVSKTKKPAPTHADVSYGPHERNTLDLWLAKSDAPTPLVVYIHGGGFVNGSKTGVSADMIKGLLDAGVSIMAINYRFRSSAPIQDILRDCARSIQFVRSKATDYNVDPVRIASYGGSAGAGTSLWLAFHPDLADPANADPVLRQSSRIVAAGAINAQATYKISRWAEILGNGIVEYERPGETAAFYGAPSVAELDTPRFEAVRTDVDMLALVSKDDPPVFLYSSQPDGPVANRGHLLHHPNHARAVKQACDVAGVPATIGFAMAKPRLEGDYQEALRQFLLEALKAAPPAR